MNVLEIMDISFRMSKQELENELSTEENAYSATANIKHTSKELVMKMSGKNMYQITFENDDKDTFQVVAEIDDVTGDVVFTPNRIQNRDKKFYTSSYVVPDNAGEDCDPSVFFANFAIMQANKRGGNFVCRSPHGVNTVIIGGKLKRTDNTIAIVDEDGNVYSLAGAKTIKHGTEDNSFRINTPINVWLKDNAAVAMAISSMSNVSDKMDYIGQYLINARLNDEIESDEFIDIFRQAGIIGFTKKSVQNIYKLLT